jgi:uncharacterized protein (DUF58 family)
VDDRIQSLVDRVHSWGGAPAERVREELDSRRALLDWAGDAWRTVTPLGRSIMIVGVGSWVIGWIFGWFEFMIIAAACLGLFLVGLAFILRKSSVDITLKVDPPRVTAGAASAGMVSIANRGGRADSAIRVEVPVGTGVATYDVPSLASGETHEEIFLIPTTQRGIIPVGPATAVRSDPVGLFQRMSSASGSTELIVHPLAVPLDPFGTGLLRDLEGRETNDLSSSDLAFHALREFEYGDDRRHIHWRSSAKLAGVRRGTGPGYLVRQYLDTQRSAFCIVVDGRVGAYGDSEEFERALQVAASVALRGCNDGVPSVLVAGGQSASGTSPRQLLDALARAHLTSRGGDLLDGVGRSVAIGAEVSVAVLISGSGSERREFDRAGSRLAPDVRTLGIRIVPGEPPLLATSPRGVVGQLSELADLPRLLRQKVAA